MQGRQDTMLVLCGVEGLGVIFLKLIAFGRTEAHVRFLRIGHTFVYHRNMTTDTGKYALQHVKC